MDNFSEKADKKRRIQKVKLPKIACDNGELLRKTHANTQLFSCSNGIGTGHSVCLFCNVINLFKVSV